MQVEEEEERRGGHKNKVKTLFFLEDTSVRAALRVFFRGGDLQAAWGPSEGGFHSQTRAM